MLDIGKSDKMIKIVEMWINQTLTTDSVSNKEINIESIVSVWLTHFSTFIYVYIYLYIQIFICKYLLSHWPNG